MKASFEASRIFQRLRKIEGILIAWLHLCLLKKERKLIGDGKKGESNRTRGRICTRHDRHK
jgi:hypothetical protein